MITQNLRWATCLGFALLVVTPARPSWCVEALEPEVDQPAFEEELTVVGRAISSPAATVTIIDRELIEASNVRSAAELLRNVSGTYLASYGSRGGSSVAQIRGGDPNFTLVLLDGIPLNDSTDIEGGTFNLASLPVQSIERIEVVHGPNSFFFGSSAMAGVINIVTRRGANASPHLEASVELGDASLFRGFAAYSGKQGETDYIISAGWDEEEQRVADDSFQQLNLQANLATRLSERSSVRLTARHTDWQSDDYPEGSGGPTFGSGDLRTTESREQSLGVDLSLATGSRWLHNLSATLSSVEVDRVSPAIFPAVPPSVENRHFDRQRIVWLSRYQPTSGAALSFGASAEREDAENDSTLLLPPFLGGAVAGDYDLERTTPGGFVELEVERAGLLVEAGLRADLPRDLDTAWSPRVALSYRLAERGLLLRGSWSRAFKLPSIFGLASPPQLGGNPALRPERAVGADIGLEYESDSGGLAASLSLFRNHYSDLIDFDFEAFMSLNLSRVDAEGMEVTLRWRPHPDWTALADLTWQDVRNSDSTRPLRNHPEHFGSLRLAWRPGSNLSLQLEGRYVGPSFDEQIPVPQLDSVDGYEVLDLALSWNWAGPWQVRARIDNLTDRDYESFVGFPHPGRSARIGLRYRPR